MKKKILLPIYLVLSLIIIVSAVVVSLTAGINLGIDFVGGKQIEIQIPENANINDYSTKISDVLDDYELKINTSFVEDKYTNTYYVVKINTQELSAEEKLEIREKIANTLSVEISNVSEVFDISGNVKQKTVISIGVGVIVAFVALFIAGWLRYGIMEGLGIMFGAIHNMIISFACLVLTRIELSISTCASIAILSICFVGLFVLVLERARETLISKTNNTLEVMNVYSNALKSNIFIPVVLLAILLFSVATLFVNSNAIVLFALSAIVCVVVAFYSLLVTTALTGYLSEAKAIRDRENLSKNKTNN